MCIAYMGIVSAVLIEDEFPFDLSVAALQSKNWWSTKTGMYEISPFYNKVLWMCRARITIYFKRHRLHNTAGTFWQSVATTEPQVARSDWPERYSFQTNKNITWNLNLNVIHMDYSYFEWHNAVCILFENKS